MSSEMPSVSIILVNYNNYKDTVECVKSLLNVNYPNFNIILVDNASTEDSSILNDEFLNKHTHLIASKTNNGFSAGNNMGIEYAKKQFNPDYFLLLNNDTVVEPDFLIQMIDCACRYKNAAAITGKIYYFSERNMLWYAGGYYNLESGFAGHDGYNKVDDGTYNKEKEVSFITGCLILIHKDIINNIGLLDESYFLYSEDTDYSCRLMKNGYKLIYCPTAMIYHKVSASAGKDSPMQQYYMLRNDLYMISKYGKRKILGYIKRINNTRIQICKGSIEFSLAFQAYRDFLLGIKGKNYPRK